MNSHSAIPDNLNWIEIFLEKPIDYSRAKAAFQKNFLTSVFDANEYQINLILTGMQPILTETILELGASDLGNLSALESVFKRIIHNIILYDAEVFNAWLLKDSNFENLARTTDDALLPILLQKIHSTTLLEVLKKTKVIQLQTYILDGLASDIYQSVLHNNLSKYERIDKVLLQRTALKYIMQKAAPERFSSLTYAKQTPEVQNFFTDASCIRLINKELENLAPERLKKIARSARHSEQDQEDFILHLKKMLDDPNNQLLIADIVTICQSKLLDRLIFNYFRSPTSTYLVKLIKIIEIHTHQTAILEKLSFDSLDLLLRIIYTLHSIQPSFIERIIKELAKKLKSFEEFMSVGNSLKNSDYPLFINCLDANRLSNLLTSSFIVSLNKNLFKAEIFLRAIVKHQISIKSFPYPLLLASELNDDSLFLSLLALQGRSNHFNLGKWLISKLNEISNLLVFCLQLDEKTIFTLIDQLTIDELFVLNEEKTHEELIKAEFDSISEHIKNRYNILLEENVNIAYQQILAGSFSKNLYSFSVSKQLIEMVLTKICHDDPNLLGPLVISRVLTTLFDIEHSYNKSVFKDHYTRLVSKLNFDSLSQLLQVEEVFGLYHKYGNSAEYSFLADNFAKKAYPQIRQGLFEIENYHLYRRRFRAFVFDYICTLPFEEQKQVLLETLTEDTPLNRFLNEGAAEGFNKLGFIKKRFTHIADQLSKQCINRSNNLQRFKTFMTVYNLAVPDNNSSFESLDMIAMHIKLNPEGIEQICMSIAEQIILHANEPDRRILLSEAALSLMANSNNFSQLFPEFCEALKMQKKPAAEPKQSMVYYSFFSVAALKDDADKKNAPPVTHTSDYRYLGKSVLNN